MKYLLLALTATLLLACKNEEKEPFRIKKNTTTQTQTPLQKSVDRGKEVYSELCITCHMANGKGVAGAFPPLNPSDWLVNKRIKSIHAVKYGLKGPIEVNGQPYNNVMLPLGLDDEEVADVMNYTIQTWNSGEMVTVEEVKAVDK